MKDNIYYIYILECSNSKYYTGYTNDIKKRFAAHVSGRASKFTRGFKPGRIAACWRLYGGKSDALKIEALIKSKKKNLKDILIKAPGKLNDLISQKLDTSTRLIKLNRKQLNKIQESRL